MKNVLGVFGDSANDYQLLQGQELREKAEKLNYKCDVVFADQDGPIGQIHHIFYGCLNKPSGERPDILIVEPMGTDGIEGALRKAAACGVCVGVINQQLSSKVFVTSDPVATAVLQAKQCHNILPAGGKVLVIAGPYGTKVAQGRLEGLRKGLEGSNISVAHTAYMLTWNSDKTTSKSIWEAMGWLEKRNLSFDLVACQNDAFAMTTLPILEELHRSGIPVIGIDGTPAVGRMAVDQKKLRATIAIQPGGGAALEEIDRFLKGQAYNPHVTLSPVSYPETLAA